MRRLLVLAVVFVAILAGLWLGGETLLARQLRKAAAQDPGFQIGAVTELRELRRIGVHLADLRIDRPTGALTLPMAELWLAPSRLTEARLTLPDTATLETAAGPKVLGLSGAGADLRLRPLSGLTLGSMGLHSGAMTLDGAALANGVKVSAELGRLGGDSPQRAIAAYDLDIDLGALDANLLTPELDLPGLLALQARGRVWLDRAPSPWTLQPGARPLPVGFRIDDGALTLGKVTAHITGRVQADAEGRAEGELTLSTTDLKPLLQAAANAGLIPKQAVVLAETVAKSLGNRAGAPEPAADATGPELRLPLKFADGKMHLGPLPLGPAPIFPR